MGVTSRDRIQNIRPLRSREDLLAVADLVELCFADSMDADGRDYLRHIRRIDQNSMFYGSGSNSALGGRLPVQGYVWEEEGRIVGNLTLIPFIQRDTRIYLIANVAVHPHFRRRGIARELTLRGLAHAWAHSARTVWLHVRDDNRAAQDLYRSIGFIERTRRATWVWEPPGSLRQIELPEGMRVDSVRVRDWPLISAWLDQTYPPEVSWNFRFEKGKYKPGFMNEFLRFLKDQRLVHLGGYLQNRLIGSIAWEPTNLYADLLWIASDPEFEEEAIVLLLGQIRRWLPANRPLSVNYPAGRAETAFEKCDFSKQNTLIWMENRYSSKGGEEQ
jgi:ribosomal protein S18 acetylase RimI-like enzyme